MARTEVARLRQIEAIAEDARSKAATDLEIVGLTLDRDTDIQFVATVITKSGVESVPNLTHSGGRLAGCLEWLPRGGNIYYEAYDPLVRQRFSVAHELGHFFLHAHLLRPKGTIHEDPAGRDEDLEEETYRPEWELEADAFAAAFLLPALHLHNDLTHFGPAIPFLAERHHVAEATCRRRIRTLELLTA